MSADSPASITEWLQTLPISWLVGNSIGAADVTSYGTVMDGQASLVKQAAQAHFPSTAPVDALPHIGGDRQLIQGTLESEPDFRTRLHTAWDEWALAGTWVELLYQLFFLMGGNAAVIVQQNGLAYSLSADPVAGEDPTSLLVVTDLGTLCTPMHSDVTLSRSVPADNSWWTFDSNTDLCSRFAILFPSPTPLTRQTVTVTFTGTEDGSLANPWPVATWLSPFPDTDYLVQTGLPTITGTDGGVTAFADNTTKTLASISIGASAPFVGTVDVLAWPSGGNPFANINAYELSRLRIVISTWRPAKAQCVGIYLLAEGRYWGWPVRLWGDGGTWGPSIVVSYSP